MKEGNLIIDSCDNLEQVIQGRWQQHATRAFFFIGGFGAASWAPLVPLLKARLGIDNDMLGVLLLCIGVGSVITMPVTGGQWLVLFVEES